MRFLPGPSDLPDLGIELIDVYLFNLFKVYEGVVVPAAYTTNSEMAKFWL